MIARVPMASSVEDSTVVRRAQAAIAAAAEHLALPPPDLAPTALGRQLDDLSQRLEQRIKQQRTVLRQSHVLHRGIEAFQASDAFFTSVERSAWSAFCCACVLPAGN